MAAKQQRSRWSEERILSESRRRTRSLNEVNSDRIKAMLAGLVEEAGWTHEEFLDAMCRDAIEAAQRQPPKRTRSGVQARAVGGEEDVEKKKLG